MKALSVKNPFAGLIVKGQKTIEVRTRRTSHRGKIAICSSKKAVYDKVYMYYKEPKFGIRTYTAIEDYEIGEMPNGFILGYADLVDIREYPDNGMFSQRLLERRSFTQLEALKEYFGDRKYFCWVLENAVEIEPIPIKGQLGVFNIPYEITDFKIK